MAQSLQRPDISNVSIGIQGRFKVGCWSPIMFEITGPKGATVEPTIGASDPDGHRTFQPLQLVELTGDQPVRVESIFRSGKRGAPVQLVLREENAIVDTVNIATTGENGVQSLSQNAEIWLLAGDLPAFTKAAERWNSVSRDAVQAIAVEDLRDLSGRGDALETLDLIVLDAGIPVRNRIAASIRDWVAHGGHLILTIGDAGPEIKQGPLAHWLPIVPSGQLEIRNLGGLNAAVPGSSQLRIFQGRPLTAARIDEQEGTVLASGLDGPIVMRAPYGAGLVTVVSVAIDERPISTWDNDSASDFAAFLADVSPPWNESQRISPPERAASALNPTGVSDLQTQLLNSLDDFSEIPRASHWYVLGWIALFLLVIGPIDFLILKRVINRPQWTWLTLPVVIVVASAFAIILGE